MDHMYAAVVVMLLSVFIARVITERAGRKLDKEKKAELVDIFSGQRIYRFGFILLMLLIYLSSVHFNWLEPRLNYLLYSTILLIFLFYSAADSYRKLKKNGFPNDYIRQYMAALTLTSAGMILFLVLMIYSL